MGIHPASTHRYHTNRQQRLQQPLDELIVPILGQAYVRYPSVALGTCPQSIITDQITDQNTPYCGELAYAVCNENRVLAVIRCISREPNPLHPHQHQPDYGSILADNPLITFS